MTWSSYRADEFCSSVRDGTHDSPKSVDSGGHPLITSKHIKNGAIDLSNAYHISESDFKQINERSQVDQWDVLITMIGTLGEVALVKDLPTYAIKNIGLFKSKSKYDGMWLYYFLQSPEARHHMNAFAQGSTQQYLPLKTLRSFPISSPDDPIEKKTICEILNQIDHKIELNQKMNETLEEMARAIFQSWFIDFDPVRAKMEGRPTGLSDDISDLFPNSFGDDGLPMGWQEVCASKISNITIGKTPPRKEKNWFSNSTDDIKWVSIRDMGEAGTYIFNTAETLTKQAIDRFNIRMVPENTVILSFKLTVGRVSLTDEIMATNEAIAHFGQLDSKYGDIQPEYLYSYLKQFNFENLGSTSSIATAVNSKTIKAMPIMLADAPCREAFYNLVSPFFARIKINLRENQTLAKLRDTLLPKLISGELRIKDMENF